MFVKISSQESIQTPCLWQWHNEIVNIIFRPLFKICYCISNSLHQEIYILCRKLSSFESIILPAEYFQKFFINLKDYIIQTVTERRLGEVCCQKNERLNTLILTQCNQHTVAKWLSLCKSELNWIKSTYKRVLLV